MKHALLIYCEYRSYLLHRSVDIFYNFVQYLGFLSVKKSTLALTALPELRSTAVAMISVSPNFISTCS